MSDGTFTPSIDERLRRMRAEWPADWFDRNLAAIQDQLAAERAEHERQVAELRAAAQAVVEVWDSWHYCPGDGGSLQAAVRKLRMVLNADTERPGDGTDRT